MKNLALGAPLAALLLAFASCAAPQPERGAAKPIVGEAPGERRIVGWRLVERTFGTADAGHAGDGEIPSRSRTLVYAPVFEEPRERVREYGAVRLRSSCEHEVTLTIKGGSHHAVGSRVMAVARIEAPAGLYHEIGISKTAESIEVLEVQGALEVAGRPGRYFVEGFSTFQVAFTSHVAGQSGIEIAVLREVGRPPNGKEGEPGVVVAPNAPEPLREERPAPVGRE